MDTNETDYRKLTTIQLKYELKQLERRILEITGDPLETGFRKFLTWANDKSAVEQVDEMMSTRSYLLNILFEKHCTPEEISRLEKVNTLLKELSERTYKRTGNLARKVLSTPHEELDDDFTIESKLVPEFDIPYSVLRLADDAFYCSDFIRMAAVLQETEEFKPGMADIYWFPDKVQSYTPAISDKELGCADEMDDGTSWAEAWLAIPPLQHINVCYALHALATHQNWSIPDILRINDFKIEVQLTIQQFSDQERNRLQWWNKYDVYRFKDVLLHEAKSRPEDLPLETFLLQRCRDYFEEHADEVLAEVGITDIDRYLETLKNRIDNP